ncbi:MAG: magnesium chelatase subunit D [Erythrobacter sp.]|jgi:magnesium chelatase subunit D|nr:magnesium chelatase subunit D [Erythrobacter sp.]
MSFPDAVLAARLFLAAPERFGGIVLRGASPARDALVAALQDALTSAGRPVRRLPGHVDDARLLGGIDIAASLACGRPVEERGLLAMARGGALVVPMAERLDAGIAGRLAQALDYGESPPALILLDDGLEADEAPPASLIERCALWCDLSAARESACEPLVVPGRAAPAALDDEARGALVTVAASLGIVSVRPLLFAQAATSAHAALHGRAGVEETDLAAAVRLVLAPRARQMPEQDSPGEEEREPPPPPPPPPDQPEDGEKDDASDPSPSDKPLEEMLVEAAAAAIPADLLAQLAQGRAPRRSGGGGTGKRRKSGLRGKPLGARPGMPRGGARLALIDTLRAAVPWQELRRREDGAGRDAPIRMRKEDLRVRRFEDKAARVTIFALDASGSAAAARLAEAKGAIELMLAQAYVTRSEVAVIAFRAETAELLLPPTRSLTRARRALAELPGGGGTPLAMGLNAARECAAMVLKRGRSPSLVVLTDGRANLDAEGQPGRRKAAEDAEAAARAIAREGIEGIVIDISARAGPEGKKLAEAMQARYLALPRADAGTLAGAIGLIEGARREKAA